MPVLVRARKYCVSGLSVVGLKTGVKAILNFWNSIGYCFGDFVAEGDSLSGDLSLHLGGRRAIFYAPRTTSNIRFGARNAVVE
jgi:hypothetical protein